TLAFTLSLGTRFVAFQFNLELFGGFDLFSGLRDCVVIEDRAFAKRIDNLFRGKDDFELLCLAKGELYAFAGRLGLRSPEEIRRLMLGGREYAPLFARLNDGLDARTPVGALAAAMKLSPEQLSRRFHRDFGMTVKECMSRRLLRAAMAKLAQPGMTARRTARELKFSSEFYFSRFFKQHAGLSPRQFKQQFVQGV
ncbi:MAG: AraC family transcriptional regulator, partial [Lentisphaeria bacterium]